MPITSDQLDECNRALRDLTQSIDALRFVPTADEIKWHRDRIRRARAVIAAFERRHLGGN